MTKNSNTWGIVAGLAIALASAIGILTRILPPTWAGLPAVLAIAVIVGTCRRQSRAARP
jgi:hypothetical protein